MCQPWKKTVSHPRGQSVERISQAVGENIVETTGEDAQAVENEEEVDSEKIEFDEAIDEDILGEEAATVPVVEEEGQRRKRRLKKATSTGPSFKKARKVKLPRGKNQRQEYILSLSGEPTDLPRVVPLDVPNREAVLDASGPTTTELDKEDKRKTDHPSGVLVIPVGSDGGLRQLLGQAEGVEEPKVSGVIEEEISVPREGKGVMVVENEEEREEMEEGGYEGDVTLSGKEVAKAPSVKRSCKMHFTRGRLRSPSSRMVANYMDALMGPANRVTMEAMERLPLRHELTYLSRCMAEASVLTGHAIHGVKRCKIIARLKEEKRVLGQDLREMKIDCDASVEISEQMKADIDMVMKENAKLQTALEKEREEREKSDEQVKTLDSRMDAFKELKLKLNTDLDG
ncbi:hypothetical protein Dimus_005370 [Dionaea muscipula]